MTTAALQSQPVAAARSRSDCGSDDAMAAILSLLDEEPRSDLFLRHWLEYTDGYDQDLVLRAIKELLRQELVAVERTVVTCLDTQRILKLAEASAIGRTERSRR